MDKSKETSQTNVPRTNLAAEEGDEDDLNEASRNKMTEQYSILNSTSSPKQLDNLSKSNQVESRHSASFKLAKQLAATSQIGGKGTIRRRRLRHSLRNSGIDTEQIRLFHSKFRLADLGQMDRVTFIQDDGKLTSYDAVPVHANTKLHLFHFDLYKYKNPSLSRTKAKPESSNQSGMHVERADQLLKKLNYINQQEPGLVEGSKEFSDLNNLKMRIHELVGTLDAFNYLSNL